MKLWEEYAEIRAEALRMDGNFQKATDFYLSHRADMDAGAVVSWEARFNHDEASALQHVIYDTNYWKSFVHARFAVPLGDKGSLSLYGRVPGVHQLLAGHLTAEYRVKTQGRGRSVDEWKLKPERNDNHWLDCCAVCAVCLSCCMKNDDFTEVRYRIHPHFITLS